MAHVPDAAQQAVKYAQAQARSAMWQKGVKFDDLASTMGVSQGTISNWLGGKRLDFGILTLIAKALDEPIARFVDAQNWK